MRGTSSFAVEHYLPKEHFPHLTTDYSNLFYCCNACNSFKGDWYPSDVALHAGQFYPNPCAHVLFSHMRFKGAVVEPTSVAGEFAVKSLDLNEAEAVKYREFVLDNIELWCAQIAELERRRGLLAERLQAGRISRVDHDSYMALIDEEVAKANRHLSRFEGR